MLAGVVNFAGEKAVFKSFMLGFFNLYNILAAIGGVKMLTEEKLETICSFVENFGGVSGRMEVVNWNPLVVIDFAHTHDGIKNALNSFDSKNIVSLFGAGGNRDREKRAKMGKMAEIFSKKIYLTNDNPRNEDPKQIINDILLGIENKQKVQIILDRKKAIQKALKELKKNEILVILGKGDEQFQEINDKILPFNDKEVVLEILQNINGSWLWQ